MKDIDRHKIIFSITTIAAIFELSTYFRSNLTKKDDHLCELSFLRIRNLWNKTNVLPNDASDTELVDLD